MQTAPARPAAMWNRDFVVLIVLSFFTHMGFQVLIPNLPKYAMLLGAASAVAGFVPAAYSMAALLTRPVSGDITDRWSKKLLLCLSLLGIALTTAAYLFVKTPVALIVARFLNGVFFGVNTTVELAMVAGALPEHKLNSGIGVYGMATLGGEALAPSIGIYVIELAGYNALFLTAVALALVGLGLSFLVRSQPTAPVPAAQVSRLERLVSLKACLPSAIGMLHACARGAIAAFLLLLAEERGIGSVGLYFLVFSLSFVASRPVFGLLDGKVKDAPVIYFTLALAGITMVILNFVTSLPVLIAAAVLFGISTGGIIPLVQTMCIRQESPARRGAASSTYYIGADMGNGIGPIMMGAAAAYLGYGGAYLTILIPLALGAVLMVILNRRERAARPSPQEEAAL